MFPICFGVTLLGFKGGVGFVECKKLELILP